MIKRIREHYFTLRHVYENPIDRQRARLLLLLTWATVAALAIWVALIFLPRLLFQGQFDFRILLAAVFVGIIEYFIYRLLQSGRLRAALWVFIGMVMVVTIQQVVFRIQPGPDLTPTPIMLLTIPVVAAGILLSRRGTVLIAIIIVAAVIAAGVSQNKPLDAFGFIPEQVVQVSIPDAMIALGIILLFLLGFVGSLEQTASESLREIKQREWVALFGTELSVGASEEDILKRAVNLMNERFNYLLIRIYLTEEDGNISRSVRGGMGQEPLIERTIIRIGDPSGISEVLRTQQSTLLRNNDLPARRAHMLASANLALAIPIISGKTVLGVLDIQSAQLDSFTESENTMLGLLANEIAIALRYSGSVGNLERALQEREGDLARLQSQLQEFRLRDRQSLGDIWTQYMSGRGGAIGYDMEAGNDLNIVAASDLPPAIYNTLKNGKPHTEIIDDEQVINVPIIFRNITLGAMCFSIPREQAVSERQLEMAEIVAERLALALENTRLFEQSQSQATRERKASEVGNLLIGATDVRALLNLAAEQFNEALGAVHTQIFIQPDILAEPLARTAKEEAR